MSYRENKITTINGNSSDSSLELPPQEETSSEKEATYSKYAGSLKEILQQKNESKGSAIDNNNVTNDISTTTNNLLQQTPDNLCSSHLNNTSLSNGTKTHSNSEFSSISTSIAPSVSLSSKFCRLENGNHKTSNLDCTSLRLFRKRKNEATSQNFPSTSVSNMQRLPGLHAALTRNMDLQNFLSSKRFETTNTDDSDLKLDIIGSQNYPRTQNRKGKHTSTSVNNRSSLLPSSHIQEISEENTNYRSTYRYYTYKYSFYCQKDNKDQCNCLHLVLNNNISTFLEPYL